MGTSPPPGPLSGAERGRERVFANYSMKDLVQVNNDLTRKDLFEAFKVQLAKDFVQSNFPADFVETLAPDYTLIHERIVRELQRAEKSADAKLMSLLYRIDISEAQLKRYLDENPDQSHLVTIAELIIKRVLQKVVIKKYYRGSAGERNIKY
jgi:hypothetical protein